MVSDFIEEKSNDFLHFHGKHARLCLGTQSQGYFDSPKFFNQVDNAIDILETYPNHRALFIFW